MPRITHAILRSLRRPALRVPPSFGGRQRSQLTWIDEESGLPHIWRHAVTEREVEEVLRRPGDDRPARDGARMAMGRTNAGRFLMVIYVPDEDGQGMFVVTAYEMRGKLLAAYHRRMKGRQ